MKTIQDVCDEYNFNSPSQLNGTYWMAWDDRKDERVCIRLDVNAGWVEIFRLAEFQPTTK